MLHRQLLHLLLIACAAPLALATGLPAGSSSPERVVVVLLDDVGVDRIGAYGEHPDPGRTPNMDALAARGMLFRNAWSTPYCSPTRAAVLTGRFGFRTGVGATLRGPQQTGFQQGLGPDEFTIPDALGANWRSICVGKWHLADLTQPITHPLELGFDHYSGSLFNLGSAAGIFDPGYYRFRKTIDATQDVVEVYATSDTARDAVRALQDPGPLFLWVAFHAAHTPRHAPPAELHGFDLSGDPSDTPVEHTKAMIEAMDTELGTILDALGPEDLVFVIGDNGTEEKAITAPFPPDHGKGTLYEGGVGVPFIVAGPGVPAAECAGLVSVTDVFATVCELAGRPSPAEDSVSLVPYFDDPGQPSLRPWLYAEHFRPNGFGPPNSWAQAMRDGRYKWIRREGEPDELYDLQLDPFEQQNLLPGPLAPEARQAYGQLLASRPKVY